MVTSKSANPLLFITDKQSKKGLVATGAEISFMPVSKFDGGAESFRHDLITANDHRIRIFRDVIVKLDFGKTFTWKFVSADINQPILGADFWEAYKLQVGLSGR